MTFLGEQPMAELQFLKSIIDEAIFKGLHPKTQKLAETTRIPKRAFVALQIPKYESRRDPLSQKWENVVTAGIMWLDVDDQPDQLSQIKDQIENRYGRILCYGNFPTHDAKSKKTRMKYEVYSEGEDLNPWDILAQFCDMHMGKIVKVNEQVNALEQAVRDANLLAEAEKAENAKLKAELEALKPKGKDETKNASK